MVDVTAAHDGHGLEAAVRMLRKARDDAPVVHAPAVLAGEVLAKVAPGELRLRPHPLVARRVGVIVVDAEEEWIGRLPGEPEWADLQNDVVLHPRTFITSRKIARSLRAAARERTSAQERGTRRSA